MTALSLNDVAVKLGGRTVVEPLSAQYEPGRLVTILGPNGAGKTTLLRAIAGLLPHSGTIALAGADAASLNPRERARRVSYLPQGHVAYWPIAARDVVALGRFPHGLVDPSRLSSADAAAVDEAMALTGTSAFATRRVTDLSGGERARVALARVVVGGAAIVLADEPTAALDPLYQLEIMALLRTLANRGALVMAVTHDLTLAARYADEVLVLEGGRCIGAGSPQEAMTDGLLARAFGIATFRGEHEGERVILPWRPL